MAAHRDREAEIAARRAEFTQLRESGHEIVAQHADRKNEIQVAVLYSFQDR